MVGVRVGVGVGVGEWVGVGVGVDVLTTCNAATAGVGDLSAELEFGVEKKRIRKAIVNTPAVAHKSFSRVVIAEIRERTRGHRPRARGSKGVSRGSICSGSF